MAYVKTAFVWFFSLFMITYCNEGNQTSSSIHLFQDFKEGDLILSGMFPITVAGNVTKSGQHQCTPFPLGKILFEAFRYAVEQVNNRSILKGMALGYDARDTCSRVDQSVKIALSVQQSMEDNSKSNYVNSSKKYTNKYIAVIGAGKSELSITVNDILSAFGIPQVGYASTSKILSDNHRFQHFLGLFQLIHYKLK